MSSELPQGWTATALSTVAQQIDYGYTASADELADGPKFLRITDLQRGSVDWSRVPRCACDPRSLARFAIAPGDLVIARTGATTGKSFLVRAVPEPAVFASYLIRVRPALTVDSAYLAAFTQSPDYWEQITQVSKGTAQPGANASILGAIELPLPPLNEQRRIVAKLEDLLARSRRAKDALNTIGFQEQRAVEYWTSARWPTSSLGSMVELREQRAGSSWAKYPVVGLSNEGTMIARREPVRAKSGPNCVVIHPGDIVFNPIRLSIGSIARYRGAVPAIASPEYVALRATAVSAELLVRYLRSSYGRALLETLTTGSVRYRVYFSTFASLTMPAAPPDEQRRAECLFASMAKVSELQRRMSDRFSELERSVVSKAFRGELVEQDPDDEPASAMLERLAAERLAAQEGPAAPKRSPRRKARA